MLLLDENLDSMSETMSEIEDEKIAEIVDKGLEKLTIGLELQKAKKGVVEESKIANKWLERRHIWKQKLSLEAIKMDS